MSVSRRKFLLGSCMACAAAAVPLVLTETVSSCAPAKTTGSTTPAPVSDATAKMVELNKSDFGSTNYKVVQAPGLRNGILVYKAGDGSYQAHLMKCTHMGANMNVQGDHISCPSHGSAFDFSGNVTKGPARAALQSFPVTVNGDKIIVNFA